MGVGDELDSIPRSDQKRHKMEDLKDRFLDKKVYPRMIEAEAEDYARIVSTCTKPEQWLGHISGNHPLAMTQHNYDPTQYMCGLLKHTFLGYSAFIPMQITYSKNHTIPLMIMAHHGFGGANARKEGGDVNAYIDHAMRYEGWDIAVYGHRHKKFSVPVLRIKPQEGGSHGKPAWVREVEKRVCESGTYLKTLAQGTMPTYAEKFGYYPRPLGCLSLEIGLKRHRDGGKDNYTLRFVSANV